MDIDFKITKAEYYNDYKLSISFSDGKTNIFDYKNLVTSERKEYQPYLDITKFKKFKIQRNVNCIAWGKDNSMQIPAYILYFEKKSSIGWTKNETTAELKRRLPKKFYYEMFVDNSVWAGIHVIVELLEGDKNTGLFSKKFNNGANKNYFFEVYTNEFVLKVKLHQFGLSYDLSIKNIGGASYKVNFENEVIGLDLNGEVLKKYEILFTKTCMLIKKNRKAIKTKFGIVK